MSAAELERLAADTRDTHGHFIALAVHGPGARPALCAALRRHLARDAWRLRTLALSGRAPDLERALARAGHAPGRTVTGVHGIERLHGEALRAALSVLNIRREALARHGSPMVFWLTAAGLQRVMREAPDFFAYRGGIYDLRRGAR